MIYLFPVLKINEIINKQDSRFIKRKPLAIISKQDDQDVVSDFNDPIYNGKLDNPDTAFYYKIDTTIEKNMKEVDNFIQKYGLSMVVVNNEIDDETKEEVPVKIYQSRR
jgi:hypothetical protein